MESNLVVKDGKITSLEILEQINFFRKQEDNKTELRHDTLLNIIRDEFEEEISLQNILESTYKNDRGREYPMFELSLAQAKQVLVRESKYVRKAIIKRLDELEKTLANPLAMYEGKDKWDLILLHAQAEKEKEILALENKQIKEQVVEIKSCLNNLEADTRVNINQAIKRLADLYCKHNKLSGVDREGIHREIYQTIYTGFCKEYEIDFKTIKDKQYISLKTGKPCKTKQSFIKIIESMGLTGILMDYVCNLKATEIEVGGTKCLN